MEVFEGSNPAPRTVEPPGEPVMATVPGVLDAMAPVLHEPGVLLFDLRDRSFMDTSGIHEMTQIAASLADGSLLLAGPRSIVKRVLERSSLGATGDVKVLGAAEDVVEPMDEVMPWFPPPGEPPSPTPRPRRIPISGRVRVFGPGPHPTRPARSR
jgi:anti-anti-sigma regulatory factor